MRSLVAIILVLTSLHGSLHCATLRRYVLLPSGGDDNNAVQLDELVSMRYF